MEWESRAAYLDPRIGQHIIEWVDSVKLAGPTESITLYTVIDRTPGTPLRPWLDQSQPGANREVQLDDKGRSMTLVYNEIAPRSWYPHTICNESLESWWARHLKQPEAISDVDPVSPCHILNRLLC